MKTARINSKKVLISPLHKKLLIIQFR